MRFFIFGERAFSKRKRFFPGIVYKAVKEGYIVNRKRINAARYEEKRWLRLFSTVPQHETGELKNLGEG